MCNGNKLRIELPLCLHKFAVPANSTSRAMSLCLHKLAMPSVRTHLSLIVVRLATDARCWAKVALALEECCCRFCSADRCKTSSSAMGMALAASSFCYTATPAMNVETNEVNCGFVKLRARGPIVDENASFKKTFAGCRDT